MPIGLYDQIVKAVLLKTRKQVRIYIDPTHAEILNKLITATELPETTICNAIVAAGLNALEKGGSVIHFPLRFKIEDPKKI